MFKTKRKCLFTFQTESFSWKKILAKSKFKKKNYSLQNSSKNSQVACEKKVSSPNYFQNHQVKKNHQPVYEHKANKVFHFAPKTRYM